MALCGLWENQLWFQPKMPPMQEGCAAAEPGHWEGLPYETDQESYCKCSLPTISFNSGLVMLPSQALLSLAWSPKLAALLRTSCSATLKKFAILLAGSITQTWTRHSGKLARLSLKARKALEVSAPQLQTSGLPG